MYAGIPISHNSGRIVGVHQKIDRASRLGLNDLLKKHSDFPGIRMILHFEGKNGPDGLKIKKSTKDIPWHFINPLDIEDKYLISIVENHIYNLARALKLNDEIKSAYEASWLAHAITDGLTPAHLKSVDGLIEDFFGSSPKYMGYADRKIIKGNNRRDTILKNWEYWGAGGVMANHFKYEIGVATAIASESFNNIKPSSSDIEYLKSKGFEATFIKSIRKIYSLKSYENFIKQGMTINLALEIKQIIIPEIIKCVILAWYWSYLTSQK